MPLDPSATCFIVTTDNAGNAAATTLNEFLSRVESLITKSGNVVPANRIRGVMVSHLTCKVANRFTTKAREREARRKGSLMIASEISRSDGPKTQCRHANCQEKELTFRFVFPDGADAGWLCGRHAIEAGFCPRCGNFIAGSGEETESGTCRDCYGEFQDECGENRCPLEGSDRMILALDPSITALGWAVVDAAQSPRGLAFQRVASGSWSPSEAKDLPDRFDQLADFLDETIRAVQLQQPLRAIVIEMPGAYQKWSFSSLRSYLRAVGICEGASRIASLDSSFAITGEATAVPIHRVEVGEWKGNARKRATFLQVKAIYQFAPKDDNESDALGLATWWLSRNPMIPTLSKGKTQWTPMNHEST